MSALLERLGSLVGPECVRAGATADAIDGVTPTAFVSPVEVEQVQALVRYARAEKLALIPLGSGTKQCFSAPPSRFDLALSSAQLTAVTDYDYDNLTIAAGAGATLAQLAPLLAERRQFLPFDGPFAAQATLGGVAATNSMGAKRFAYKAPRDVVVGINVVLGTGEFIQAGGKVVKNVSGFDLNKLLVGSHGTLGFITSLTVRVAPQPEREAAVIALCESLTAATALAKRVLDSFLVPSAVVVFDRTTTQRILGREAPCALLVDFESVGVGVDQQTEQVMSWCNGERVEGARLAKIWMEVNDFPFNQPASQATGQIVWKVALPLEASADCIAVAHDCGAECETLAHYSTGLVLGSFMAGEEAQLIASFQRLRQQATTCGGRALILGASPAIKRAVEVWGPTRSDFALMRGLKQAFDPDAVFSPGRFVGGL